MVVLGFAVSIAVGYLVFAVVVIFVVYLVIAVEIVVV